MDRASWLIQDLRVTLRLIRRKPVFCLTVIGILAVGLGATTAILSVVDQAFLRPLPYSNPSQLVAVFHRDVQQSRRDKATGAEVVAWRAVSAVFADVGYSWDAQYTLTSLKHPITLRGFQFSTNMFSLLGARPALGRTFVKADGQPGGDHLVVLSDHLWRSAFGASKEIVGHAIRLDDSAYTVVGVMPPTFAHPDASIDLWTPLGMPAGLANDRSLHVFNVVGRLRAEQTVGAARATLGKNVDLETLRDFYLGPARPLLWTLQIAVLLLFLIAIANVANLVLAHGITMGREVAVRRALGASRQRLAAQFACMSALLTGAGFVIALLLASFLVDALPLLLGQFFDYSAAGLKAGLTSDSIIVAGAVAAAIIVMMATLAAVGSKALPNGVNSLRGEARGATAQHAHLRARRVILVAQIALSLVLLASSGLLVTSFYRLKQRSLGFATRDRTTFVLQPPSNRYATRDAISSYVNEVLARIDAIPGVESAAATSAIPLSGMDARRRLSPLGVRDSASTSIVHYRVVSPAYFATMGIPLRRGRPVLTTDLAGSANVAVINETLARVRWPNEDPLGKMVTIAAGPMQSTARIVGVVGDVRHEGLATEPQPELYVPVAQSFWPFFGIVVRSRGGVATLRSLQQAVWSVDPAQPVDVVQSMDALAMSTLALRRTGMILVSAFAIASALLAVLGIYGVMSYLVALRKREFGIRLALGAEPRAILRGVVASASALGLVGVAIGILATSFVSRYLTSLLFQLQPMNPIILGGASLLVLGLAVIASAGPARRAASIDPAATMRDE